jgi:anti-sigma regulatory factor (Ser/Thr protein kinase)
MATLLVPHEPASAGRVRQALYEDLGAHHVDPESTDSVVLIASELLGNAIRHTPEHNDLCVSWEFESDALRVDVSDHSHETPAPRIPLPSDSSGRGLTIVNALAYEWGFDRSDAGKRVWARIPVHIVASC